MNTFVPHTITVGVFVNDPVFVTPRFDGIFVAISFSTPINFVVYDTFSYSKRLSQFGCKTTNGKVAKFV